MKKLCIIMLISMLGVGNNSFGSQRGDSGVTEMLKHAREQAGNASRVNWLTNAEIETFLGILSTIDKNRDVFDGYVNTLWQQLGLGARGVFGKWSDSKHGRRKEAYYALQWILTNKKPNEYYAQPLQDLMEKIQQKEPGPWKEYAGNTEVEIEPVVEGDWFLLEKNNE